MLIAIKNGEAGSYNDKIVKRFYRSYPDYKIEPVFGTSVTSDLIPLI
jgi:hypothetical protein